MLLCYKKINTNLMLQQMCSTTAATTYNIKMCSVLTNIHCYIFAYTDDQKHGCRPGELRNKCKKKLLFYNNV